MEDNLYISVFHKKIVVCLYVKMCLYVSFLLDHRKSNSTKLDLWLGK